MLAQLALFFLTKMGFNREFSLLFLLQLFEIEFYDPEKYLRDLEGQKKTLLSAPPVDPATDPLLNRGISIVETVRLPLFSLSRGKSAVRLHELVRLLAEFHFPALSRHLDHVAPHWFLPFSFPIERQDDFVTVGSTFPLFSRRARKRPRPTSPRPRKPASCPPPGSWAPSSPPSSPFPRFPRFPR